MTKFLCTCLLALASPALAQTTTPPPAPSWTIPVRGSIDANTTKVCVLVDQMAPVCKDYEPKAQPFAIDVPHVPAGLHIVVVMAQNPESASHATPIVVQAGWPPPAPPTDVQINPVLITADQP